MAASRGSLRRPAGDQWRHAAPLQLSPDRRGAAVAALADAVRRGRNGAHAVHHRLDRADAAGVSPVRRRAAGGIVVDARLAAAGGALPGTGAEHARLRPGQRHADGAGVAGLPACRRALASRHAGRPRRRGEADARGVHPVLPVPRRPAGSRYGRGLLRGMERGRLPAGRARLGTVLDVHRLPGRQARQPGLRRQPVHPGGPRPRWARSAHAGRDGRVAGLVGRRARGGLRGHAPCLGRRRGCLGAVPERLRRVADIADLLVPPLGVGRDGGAGPRGQQPAVPPPRRAGGRPRGGCRLRRGTAVVVSVRREPRDPLGRLAAGRRQLLRDPRRRHPAAVRQPDERQGGLQDSGSAGTFWRAY